jgi:hypothetical protein
MNNGRYFLNEGLGEKDSAHVVDRDGGKDRFDVNKSAGMIQFVALMVVSFALNLLRINL